MIKYVILFVAILIGNKYKLIVLEIKQKTEKSE